MMRCFIAVELPDALKQEVAQLQAEFKRTGADVKWVEPASLHLTIKFLGDVPEEKVAALTQEFKAKRWPRVLPPSELPPAVLGQSSPAFQTRHMEWRGAQLRAAGGISSASPVASPFTITLEGIGAFPKTTYPRVIWVGVGEGKESLVNLARCVEEICSRLGFASEERRFCAHLTIGRLRSQNKLAGLIKKLQGVEFKAATPAPVDRLILFQSTLSSKGPTYTPLAEIPLG